MSLIFAIWTVIVAIIFFAIVAWVFLGSRKERFDDAARIPLEEEELQQEHSAEKLGEDNSNG